ncbi:MAG: prepilin-type N-terminal cleavage/methylation domain-containing protein [Symploca sp. SIO2E9]|nr:prepilin-type N-terminal cleavage/methylation domain-containing protein [Symploca sp. SIO2E9]
MIKPLKFFLTRHRKRSRRAKKTSGFTLIELLVAMILASIIISSLLSFMVTMVKTDRDEQAKTASEQEIQAAAEYITRDLEQAAYIYDDLDQIKNQLPPLAGEVGGCEQDVCEPVLVFWKLQLIPDAITVKDDSTHDTSVYSLVAYYQINNDTEDTNCANDTWSCTTRIGRFQIKDAVRDFDGEVVEDKEADPGFNQPFDPEDTGTIKEQLKNWQREGEYNRQKQRIITLIDYIDNSKSGNPGDGAPEPKACPQKIDNEGNPRTDDDGNDELLGLVGASFGTSSFYACIDSDRTIAQVFLRGNAKARIDPRNDKYNPNKPAFFPSAKIEVRGRATFGS